MTKNVVDVPCEVTAEQGQVQIDSPGSMAVSMTPEAAKETGQRLTASAEEATTHDPAATIDQTSADPPTAAPC